MNTAGSNVDEIPLVPVAADVVTSEVATAAVEQGQMSEMPQLCCANSGFARRPKDQVRQFPA